jgi:hypothetical protein
MVAGNLAAATAEFQGRLDAVGLAIKVGHVIIDLHAPSFRFVVANEDGATAALLTWGFGAGASYAF